MGVGAGLDEVHAEAEPIYDGDGEARIVEGLAPLGERSVGGDGDGGTVFLLNQDLEEQYGDAGVEEDVAEFVQAE